MHVYVCACVSGGVEVRMYSCTYVHMCMCMCMHIYVPYVYVCVCMYFALYVRTCVHAHSALIYNLYIHTYIHRLSASFVRAVTTRWWPPAWGRKDWTLERWTSLSASTRPRARYAWSSVSGERGEGGVGGSW